MQVIKESQRLFPAAAIGPVRMAAENAELGGYFIPKGTRVQVSHAASSSPLDRTSVLQNSRNTKKFPLPCYTFHIFLPVRALVTQR